MIRGRVNLYRQAVVPVAIRDGNGQFQPIEFVLDTGFDGCLTLPYSVIQDLGLEREDQVKVTLAGGEEREWNSWYGRIHWHGRFREILILESGGDYLLGMELLEGSQVNIQVRIDGAVVIEELG